MCPPAVRLLSALLIVGLPPSSIWPGAFSLWRARLRRRSTVRPGLRLRRSLTATLLTIMAAVAAAPSVQADPQSDFKRLSNTFDALYAARKLREATNTARELVQLSTRMHGAEHPTTLDTMMWLANVLEVQALEEDGNAAQQKRSPDPRMRALREEAITLLKRRFDVLVARKGLGDDGVQAAQARLVNLLRAAGRKAEATALVEMRPGSAKPPSAKPATAEAPKKPVTASHYLSGCQL